MVPAVQNTWNVYREIQRQEVGQWLLGRGVGRSVDCLLGGLGFHLG